MTDSYGCFFAYHVALADSLPYQQFFMYIQCYSQRIEENFEKEHKFKNALALSVTKSSQLKIASFFLW